MVSKPCSKGRGSGFLGKSTRFGIVLFFKGRAGVFSLSQAQKRGAAGKEGPAYEAATSQVYRSQTPCLPAHRDQDLAQSRLFLYSFPMQPRER